MRFVTKYEGPWANPAEFITNKTGDWRHQRPVFRDHKCAHCGACYLFCPSGCIVDEGAFFDADLEFCKGCGVCASICPVSAIVMVREEGR